MNGIYPLVMTNIAMENHYFEWDKSTLNGDFPKLCEITRGLPPLQHPDLLMVPVLGYPTSEFPSISQYSTETELRI